MKHYAIPFTGRLVRGELCEARWPAPSLAATSTAPAYELDFTAWPWVIGLL
jgi:hypothetical protein